MNVFRPDGNAYNVLDKFVNFVLLNLLWLLLCIPVITIFPATAAMFAVVRQWRQKEDTTIFKNFFIYFKENFLQSFFCGLIWFAIAYLFYFNLTISLQMPKTLKLFIVSLLLFLLLLFALMSTFIFPIMVHYKMSFVSLIKHSVLFSITQLHVSILCILTILAAMSVSYMLPFTSVVVWSIAAYNIYRLCQKSFTKIEEMVQVKVA